MSSSQEDAGHEVSLTSPAPASSLQPSPVSPPPQPSQETTKMPVWWLNFDSPARNRFLKDYRIQAASATSTILACLAVTPLENVKTRLQSQTGVSPLVAYNAPGSLPTVSGITCFTLSGMVAGAVAAPVACKFLYYTFLAAKPNFKIGPFELAKNVVQTSVLMGNRQASPTNTISSQSRVQSVARLTTSQAIRQIISRHGFRGLYTGMGLHVTRDTIGTGLYFAIYETSKQLVSTYLGDHHSPFGPPLIAGALSGVIPWVCTYPLDTRKTRRQSLILGKSNEVGEAAKTLAKSSVYKGLSVIIARTAVQNMLLLSMFEYFKKEIDKLDIDDEGPPVV
ncbi:hypothetical protein FQN57_000322 [Myotisia sp. PD_48]|nr:hypothetical protein FQN57_000322 [Myotisia sp. PD_48]